MRGCLYTPVFEKGGALSYWDYVFSKTEIEWMVFSNPKTHTPFPNAKNVSYDEGLDWDSPIRTCFNFIRFVKKHQPDIVFLNGNLSEIYILPALLYLKIFFPKIKITCVIHNMNTIEVPFKKILYTLTLRLGSLMHRNVFVSQAVKTHWGLKGRALPRPVIATSREICEKSTYHLGFVGRLTYEKGPDLFIEMTKELLKLSQSANYKVKPIMFVGEGDYHDCLKSAPKEIDARDWSTTLSEEIVNLDMIVMTSRSEGYGLVGAESVALGTPVLGFDVGGIKEALGANRSNCLVVAGNTKELAQKVHTFFENYPVSYQKYFNAGSRSEQKDTETWIKQLVFD